MPRLPPSTSSPGAVARLPGLDAARALGVLAMVAGHTLDALLAPEVRAQPGVELYWQARGFTAPLFLVTAGWGLAVSTVRGGARGLPVLSGRLPRVALLLAVGMALRWPGWATDGLVHLEPEPWRHLLAFDVLQTIAVGLLLAASVLALPLDRGRAASVFALLAGTSLVAAWSVPPPRLPPGLVAIAAEQAAGGTSPFPLFPWLAYFFAGAVLGLTARAGSRRTALAVSGTGVALVLPFALLHPGDFAPAHPVLVGLRLGGVLLLLGLLFAVPRGVARAAAPLGRASLAVYSLHVPVVYGWSTVHGLAGRVGPSLGLGEALGLAAAVLMASFAASRLLGAASGALARAAGRAAAGAGVLGARLRAARWPERRR
ncbi:MAG TPA: heparan-alpha-glucosaminide N-acetyltransferase domain-containing protein [Anaeromyxobacteraceae bacterium]|nr:heparan-alpha-glucosaminide N-acetyltransferase domain-containing protein [Anaeromyxobacteraceae bacterium]